MNTEIELLGYKATITDIIPRQAEYPWDGEDMLIVNIDFREPYPVSTISTGILIPVRDYSMDEFLDVVKKKGERCLSSSIDSYNKRLKEGALKSERLAELEDLAGKLKDKLGGEKIEHTDIPSH